MAGLDTDQTFRKRRLTEESVDDVVEAPTTSHECTFCPKQGRAGSAIKLAEFYCVDCGDFYCDECKLIHDLFPANKGHTLMDRSEYSRRKYIEDRPRCTKPDHDMAYLSIYCRTHNTDCCPNCAETEHASCDKDFLPDVSKNVGEQENFRKTIADIELVKAELLSLKERYEKDRNDIQQEREKSTQIIRAFMDDINTRLNDLQNNSERDLQENFTRQDQVALQKLANVEEKLTKIDEYLENFKRYEEAERKLYVELMNCRAFVGPVKGEIQGEKRVQKRKSIDFVLHKKLDNLFKGMNNLGNILKTEAEPSKLHHGTGVTGVVVPYAAKMADDYQH